MNNFLFYVLSLAALLSAHFVVKAHNLFRAAIGLTSLLLCIAGLYLLIGAEFLSAVQITVYVGGIVVLIVYVVLLVADVTQKSFRQCPPWRRAAAVAVSGLLLLLLLVAIGTYDFGARDALPPRSASVAEIGTALLSPERGGFVLAFEIISLVLIAAVVGAITVARSEKAGKTLNRERA